MNTFITDTSNGPVTVVPRSTDKLDIFISGLDGHVYTAACEKDHPNWRGWRRIDGVETAPCAPVGAVSHSTNELAIFVVGLDGHIYTATFHPGNQQWQDWKPIGSLKVALDATISAASCAANQLDIFVTGLDGKIYTTTRQPDHQPWQNWGAVGQILAPSGAPVSAVSRSADKLDIFVAGRDGQVYRAAWKKGDTTWSGWLPVQDLVTIPGASIGAVSRSADKLDLFATGRDGRVYTTTWSSEDGAWEDGTPVGDWLTRPGTPVAAVARNADKLDIFVIDGGGRVQTATWEADLNHWSDWRPVQDLVAAPGTSIGAASRSPDKLDIFVAGGDRRVYTAVWEPDVNKWRGWWPVADQKSVDHIVVPPDTDKALMPQERAFDSKTLGDVVRNDFMPVLEQMTGIPTNQANAIELPDRTIVVSLSNSPILSQAPAEVQTLLAELINEKNAAAYLYHCAPAGPIWLVAKERRALQAAMFRYLHRLGCRWLAPNEAWTIIPKKKNLRLMASEIVEPRVEHLFYQGNAGLTPRGQPPSLPWGEAPKEAWADWDIHNGMPRELEGAAFHIGEGVNKVFQCEFRADRKLMAWYKGGRGNGAKGEPFPQECFTGAHTSKPCYTNHGDGTGVYPPLPAGDPWEGIDPPKAGCQPGVKACDPVLYPVEDPANDSEADAYPGVYSGFGGAVKIWAEFVRDRLALNLKQWGSYHPNTRYVTTDAADGAGDCEGDKCRDLLRSGPYGAYLTPDQQNQDSSRADRYFHFTNEIAKFIEYWFGPGYGVGVLSYSSRSDIPSIPIRSNILVQPVPTSRPDNVTQEEFHKAWGEKRTNNPWGKFRLSVTKLWALTNTNFDAPKISPKTVYTEIKWALDNGVSAIIVQNTHSSLTIGMHMLGLNEQIWSADDPNYEAHLSEWFALAFGPAAPPIRRMFERWWDYFEWTQNEVGASCRDMLEAQQIADTVGVSAQMQTRIDHVKGYVWHLYLNERVLDRRAQWEVDQNNSNKQNAYEGAMNELFNHIWAMYPSNVLHSYRLHRSNFWKMPDAIVNEDGTAGAVPGSYTERWLITNSASNRWHYIREWSSQELQAKMVSGAKKLMVSRRQFSSDLAPLTSTGDTEVVNTITYLREAKFALYKEANDVTITMRTFGTVKANNLPIRVDVTSPAGNSFTYKAIVNPNNVQVWTATPITIKGSAGLYQIEVVNPSDSTRWNWQVPRNVPFSMVDELRNNTGDYDNQTMYLYFYVPMGETKIVMSYNTKQAITFRDPAGHEVTTLPTGQYQWSCEVPAGQDGKVWSFARGLDANNVAQIGFENCPRVLAWSAEQLLVPRELLKPVSGASH